VSHMGNSLKGRHHVKYVDAYGNRIVKLILRNRTGDKDWMLLAQGWSTLRALIKRVMNFLKLRKTQRIS